MTASPKTFLDSPLVVELGSRIGVGFTGNLLAQLGAVVVAVEPAGPSVGEKWAHRPAMMAGKKSVSVDRASAEGRQDLKSLLGAADAVLLSTDVDPRDRDIWDQVDHRSTIVCDLTAFGHTGPLAGTPFSEGLVEAISGILDTTGHRDHPPVPIGTPLLEIHAALYAATAVLAARRVRRARGFGQKIDVALFDVGVTALVNFLPLDILGKEATRSGNRHPLYTPWGTYQALDGTLLVCAVTDHHWRSICDVMGRQDIANHPRFATSDARLQNYLAVDEVMNNWTKNISVQQGESALLARGIPSGAVVRRDQLGAERNLKHRRSIYALTDPASNAEIKVSASPIRSWPTPGMSPRSIPRVDEDRAIIDRLRATRVAPSAAVGACDDGSTPKRAGPGALPYSGIRIVEIGQYTVAPLASRILGALGADVIKVEAPGGDATRSAAPFREDGASYIFAISNTDKRGIVLDLGDAHDRESLHRLLSTADALVENLKPGSLAKLGFDRDTLKRRHPHLIVCSVNGFGADSAYPGRPALDTVIQAMSGLMDATQAQGQPTKAGISASDNLGGQFALLSLCAALDLLERTGVSVHIDLSMQDVSVWATQLEWSEPSIRCARPTVVSTDEGYVAIESEGGRPPPTAGNACAEISRKDIASAVAQARATPVLSVKQVMKHPQVKARQLVVECPTVAGDRWHVFSTPFKLLATPFSTRSVMGPIGATDAEVRAEIDKVQPTSLQPALLA